MHPDQVKLIAKSVGVTERDVIDMKSVARRRRVAQRHYPQGRRFRRMARLASRRIPRPGDHARRDRGVENRRRALSDALGVLNERERRIFEARQLADDPVPLRNLADEFHVSRERVRQIQVRAFEKVQEAVKNRVAAIESLAPDRCISFKPSPWWEKTADSGVYPTDRTGSGRE